MTDTLASSAQAIPAPATYARLRTERFVDRHIGPRRNDVRLMLGTLGYDSLDAFIDDVVPEDIRLRRPLDLPVGRN